MSVTPLTAAEVLADYRRFDTVIDVRSPSEYAEDHLPGAINLPVLDDAERRIVGTLNRHDSVLAARKVGAMLAARRIADHIERRIANQPRDWQPLVYCWRGGQRSGSLAWFLGQIGFRTVQLSGGYKAFRAEVCTALETLPLSLHFVVLCGRTGSGKTRLLQRLAQRGAQVLDLEGLACHRGSVLGAVPGQPQPSQKRFDTLVWLALKGFDAARPVFIESESARIGQARVPEALLKHVRETGRCVRIEMADADRVALLLQEYAFFADDAEGFCRLLDGLVELRGRDVVSGWQAQARAGQWAEVFADLMRRHYDPLYERSMRRSFAALDSAPRLALGGPDDAAMDAAAAALVQLAT